MLNSEFFANYGTEQWAVEENLCFMLQKYWETVREQTYPGKPLPLMPPVNLVSFTKEFMKENTLVEVKYAEQSKMQNLETAAIDAEFRELDGISCEMPDLEEAVGVEFRKTDSTETETGSLELVWPDEPDFK